MSSAQNPKGDRDPLSTACELVGRFQYHFSRLEASVNQGVAKVLNLDDVARDIVCSNLDFLKKINLIKAAIREQFVDKGEAAIKALSKVAEINGQNRQTVIHSTFEPLGHDGVRFRRVLTKEGELNREPKDWPNATFIGLFKRMEAIAAELDQVVANLKPYQPSLDFSDPRNSGYLPLIT
jgi:hypothetical protein